MECSEEDKGDMQTDGDMLPEQTEMPPEQKDGDVPPDQPPKETDKDGPPKRITGDITKVFEESGDVGADPSIGNDQSTMHYTYLPQEYHFAGLFLQIFVFLVKH